MKRKTWFLILSMILVLFIVGSLLANRQRKLSGNVQSFKEAPDFTLSDLDGKLFRFSELKGKVVLIDFWATWCPYCRESIPILMSLYHDYKDKGVEIVGIALEYDDGRALRQFAEEKKITYPLLIGNEKLAKEYLAYGVPTRFLINREGKIVKKFIGYQDKEVFASAIEDLL